MKKLINDVQDVLDEQLAGLAKAHPSLTLHQDPVYVTRADAPVAGKVALLSGGGSGHEPMHCGYIGQGMLSGACPGEIFTSPTPDKIFECSMQIDGGEGVLLIIKNYTGDILNFETATELLKRRTKNAKMFHDKCENFNFRASNETAALTAAFLFIKWDHFG